MGKSYNRNQDKYNKWDRERRQRDHKNNKSNKSNKSSRSVHLTSDKNGVSASGDDGLTLRSSYSDESSY